MLTELAIFACIGGILYGAKKLDDYRASKASKTQKKSDISKKNKNPSDENQKAVNAVNRDFGCTISCDNVRFFTSPSYETEYTVNGRKYISYKTLEHTKISVTEQTKGFKCDRISTYKDSYGNKVVLLIKDIPCFDSCDREYDSAHILYFFHHSGQIHALYCGEGYRIATLTLFENVKPIGIQLRSFLKNEGFPI